MKYRSISQYKYQTTAKLVVETGFSLPKDFVGNDYFVSITPAGVLTIAKGYAWNGASGPAPDVESSMKASLVHDALYQLMREQKLPTHMFRKGADDLFEKLLIEDGMSVSWAKWWWRAVRTFGKNAAS